MLEQTLIYGLLIAVILMLQVRKITTSVKLLAFQSVLLTILSVVTAIKTGMMSLLFTAALTLIVKAIVIPYILHYTIVKINIKQIVEPFINKYVSLIFSLVLIIISYYVTSRLELTSKTGVGEFLPVAVSLIFLGALIMIVHKKAIMQGIGLITIENGLFLLTISIFTGMPLVVELGIFFELLIMVIIIGILSFRIHSAFQSSSTDKLKELKG